MENLKIKKKNNQVEVTLVDSFIINDIEIVKNEIAKNLDKNYSKLKLILKDIKTIDVSVFQFIIVLKNKILTEKKEFEFQYSFHENINTLIEKSGLLSLIEIKN